MKATTSKWAVGTQNNILSLPKTNSMLHAEYQTTNNKRRCCESDFKKSQAIGK